MALPARIEQLLLSEFPEAIEASREPSEVSTFITRPNEIVYICSYLKSNPELQFDYLTSLTAVDWPDRLQVVYHLYSIPHHHNVVLKVDLDREDSTIPSVTSVWKAADWQEREVYDMFGVNFEGHPCLERILLDTDWEGFPFRKDYVEELT